MTLQKHRRRVFFKIPKVTPGKLLKNGALGQAETQQRQLWQLCLVDFTWSTSNPRSKNHQGIRVFFLVGSFYLNFFRVMLDNVLSVLERKPPVAKDVPQANFRKGNNLQKLCGNGRVFRSNSKRTFGMLYFLIGPQNDSTRKVQAVYLATPPRSWMGLG